MDNVRALARGGPEDGTELTVPTDSTGLPTARITLPARPTHGHQPRPGQKPPLLIYERHRRHGDHWHYTYVGAETQHD